MDNEKIKVKQIRSSIGRQKYQAATLKGLGLTKINQVRELEDTSSVRGMITRVQHLVKIVS